MGEYKRTYLTICLYEAPGKHLIRKDSKRQSSIIMLSSIFIVLVSSLLSATFANPLPKLEQREILTNPPTQTLSLPALPTTTEVLFPGDPPAVKACKKACRAGITGCTSQCKSQMRDKVDIQ
jgi:hypothetical protein